jgi:hypothetical protein
MDVAKGETKGLIALTPEIDCNTIAMGLQPVTSAVSRNISDTSATPSGIKHKWYVCMYVCIRLCCITTKALYGLQLDGAL